VSCRAIFTTHEEADLSSTFLVEGSTSDPTPFNRDKLFLSIYDCCRHRENALVEARHLTTTIIASLIKTSHGGPLLPAEAIRLAAVTVLERFDATAAAFYKAYHPSLKK
jgi:transcriptional regulator NrdR family protein